MKLSAILVAVFSQIHGQDKSSPIKKVDRFTKLMTKWSDEWIGENGRVGFYPKHKKVSDRLDRVRSSFRKNIVLCHPEYAMEKISSEEPDEIEDLTAEGRGECLDDTCAVSESFTVLKRFESLLTTFVS